MCHTSLFRAVIVIRNGSLVRCQANKTLLTDAPSSTYTHLTTFKMTPVTCRCECLISEGGNNTHTRYNSVENRKDGAPLLGGVAGFRQLLHTRVHNRLDINKLEFFEDALSLDFCLGKGQDLGKDMPAAVMVEVDSYGGLTFPSAS